MSYVIYSTRRCESCGQHTEYARPLLSALEDNDPHMESMISNESEDVAMEVDRLRDDLMTVRHAATRMIALGCKREFVNQQLAEAETVIESQAARLLKIKGTR